jgi:hypothetical protein
MSDSACLRWHNPIHSGPFAHSLQESRHIQIPHIIL